MGFNKKRLPPLEEAKQMLAKDPNYLDYFERADAWMGSAETARFLQEEIRKKYENENTTVPKGGHAHGSDGVLPTLLPRL